MSKSNQLGSVGGPTAPLTFDVAQLPDSMPTAVYVARQADGLILYVGMTGSLGTRLAAHQSADKWWREAHTISVEICPNRASAAARELALIEQFKPPYNRLEKLEQKARQQQARDDAFIELYSQGLTLTDIRRRLGLKYGAVSRMARRLRDEGRIERRRAGPTTSTTTPA